MIQTATLESTASDRRAVQLPTFHGQNAYFIGRRGETRPDVPQAFLVDQDPDWVLPTHFHREYQFQVVARGSGTLGRHALHPFAIHYTTPESAYGPITAGPEGLSYFTLRPVTGQGAVYIDQPGARESMRKDLKKKQIATEPPALSDAAALAARREPAVEVMIEPDADGLAAWFIRVPPNARVRAPRHANGAGRYYLVANGEMRVNGAPHPLLSTAWVPPGDEPFELVAGPQGLEVLAMQYPAAAALSA